MVFTICKEGSLDFRLKKVYVVLLWKVHVRSLEMCKKKLQGRVIPWSRVYGLSLGTGNTGGNSDRIFHVKICVK